VDVLCPSNVHIGTFRENIEASRATGNLRVGSIRPRKEDTFDVVGWLMMKFEDHTLNGETSLILLANIQEDIKLGVSLLVSDLRESRPTIQILLL
jgi:hypothetical protein